jgi:hypothetical protein
VARFRLCKSCGDLHQLNRWPHNCMPAAPARSDYPSPYVQTDSLPGGVNGLFHHAAMRKIDSKKAYRDATKAFGCIEMGNEYAAATSARPETETNDTVIESAINDALHQHGVSSDSDMGKVDYGP